MNWDSADVLSLVGFLAGLIVMKRSPMRYSSDRPKDASPCTVSIIIPARNEAGRLPLLLNSLGISEGVSRHVEVIVVDDNSDDGTSAIAADLGATTVQCPPLPEGWYGKSWACWNGAAVAEGDWFAFLDADVEVSSSTVLELTQSLGRGSHAEALSIQPWHHVPKFYEQWSLWFNILVWLGTPRKATRLHGGFGPSLIVSRESYYSVDGHRGVRRQLLENASLARELNNAGCTVTNYLGDGRWKFRMYGDGLVSLMNGWRKHFFAGARQTPFFRLLLTIVFICGAGSATGQGVHALSELISMVVFGRWTISQVFFVMWLCYALYVAQVAIAARRVGNFRFYSSIFYPLFLVGFLLIFVWSLLSVGQSTAWKGRVISKWKKSVALEERKQVKGP